MFLAAIGSAEAADPRAPLVPNERNQVVYGVTIDNRLISFNQYRPAHVLSNMAIGGLAANEQILGIDFRPATGQLYAVSSNSQLYVINHMTGTASKVGAPFTPALDSRDVGFDFNPTVDRIRLVTARGLDLRLHPDTGATVAIDGQLRYAATDAMAGIMPAVTGAAYTNPDNNPATGTVLYDIDSWQDTLVRQDPPNEGLLNTIGWLGVDTSTLVGFDIGQSNEAIAALQLEEGASPVIYVIDLMTGKAWERGPLYSGQPVRDIAIVNTAAN